MLVIILEGNISAGKSTLSRALGPLLGCKVFLEPTVTNPYLDRFYADPAKWALKMQLWLLRQRYFMYLDALRHALQTGEGVLLDRSIFSDSVFADQGLIDKVISPEGYEYYLQLRNQMLRDLPVPHFTLYLDVDPAECHRRILHERCRECESGIPLSYLAGLDRCYGKFLNDMTALGSTVLVESWSSYGESNEIARRVASAAGADTPLRKPDGSIVDRAWLASFLIDGVRVRQAMTLGHTVAGVDDSDPLPESLDFDLMNLMEEEEVTSSESSLTASPASPALDAQQQCVDERAKQDVVRRLDYAA